MHGQICMVRYAWSDMHGQICKDMHGQICKDMHGQICMVRYARICKVRYARICMVRYARTKSAKKPRMLYKRVFKLALANASQRHVLLRSKVLDCYRRVSLLLYYEIIQ